MHNILMGIMKDTTEEFTVWLDQDFLTVINVKTHFAVQNIHHQKLIDASYIVH